MKPFLSLLLALSLLAAGCDREPCAFCADVSPRHLRLELSEMAPPTKAQPAGGLLYVFSRSGELVFCQQSPEGLFDFYLTDETYDFVAISGKDDLPVADITRSELFDTVTLLDDNAADRLVMVGRLDNHVIDADEKITVEMERVAAKLTYTLHTAFQGTLSQEPFSVEDVFLVNVVGENRLSLADSLPDAGARWYNRMNREPGNEGPAGLLSGPTFYLYPNCSADSHDKVQWGSRCTRFVVKASLAGRITYYPVTLEKVRSNHHYHIDLTVANFGVDHPEDLPGGTAAIDATIVVVAWTSGGTLQGTF